MSDQLSSGRLPANENDSIISSNGLKGEKRPYSSISSVQGVLPHINDDFPLNIKDDIDLRPITVKLNHWEARRYTTLEPQERDYLKNSIEQYELKNSASLVQSEPLYFEVEANFESIQYILHKMPAYQAEFYYPIVIDRCLLSNSVVHAP